MAASGVNLAATPFIASVDNLKGCLLAVVSSTFIGSSFIIKKKGLQRAGALGARASSGGYGYLLDPLWWVGMVTMTIGEIANFIAYMYAPAVLVTPLGALSIIVSAVLAHFFLDEKLRQMGILGCLLCVVGSTIIVLHAPSEQSLESVEEVWDLATQPAFLSYIAASVASIMVLVLYCEPRYGLTNVMVYIGICSINGSLAVMSIKAVGIAIKLTLEGSSQITHFQTWVFVTIAVTCITANLNFLNKALDTFDTAIVSPIYYAMFTSFTILASAIMFKDWSGQSAGDIVSTLCGFLTVLSGTVVLHNTRSPDSPLSTDSYASLASQTSWFISGNGTTWKQKEDDGETPYVSGSLINKIYGVYSNALHFAMPNSSLRTNEADLVRGVLQILQGFSSSLFYWDHDGQRYCAKSEVYVSHLSRRGLHAILNQFLYAASCLQLVNIVVSKVEASARLFPPTLRAFSCSVSEWLKRLRDVALSEEVKISSSDMRTTPTLLGLASSLSSLCAGAEYLLQVVDGAIPEEYFDPGYVFPAAQVATHILDHLHQKLSEACLAQDGQEEAYRMLLYIFVGSLLPYIEVLDAWLYEGTLDDPFEEMFFHANKEILVDEAEFWERSYVLRPTQFPKLNPEASSITPHIDSITNGKNSTCGKEFTSTSASVKEREWKARNDYVCPSFIKGIAKSIVSAGKSLQLMRYVPGKVLVGSSKENGIERLEGSGYASGSSNMQHENNIAGLTLSEVFCVSLAGLTGDGDHIFNYFWQDDPSNFKNLSLLKSLLKNQEAAVGNDGSLLKFSCSNKIWYKLLLETLSRKEITALQSEDIGRLPDSKGSSVTPANSLPLSESLCPINPVITVCRSLLSQNMDTWNTLNISRNFNLPPLNDEDLRASIFGGKNTTARETNFRFQFADFSRSETDIRALEEVFPFPTLLPSIQEDQHISEILPFQKNSTLPSRVLSWIQTFEPKGTPLPVVIVQECLTFYIRKQVDYIGRHMLVKLMTGWRLMDELGVLRAIYLLGSGDLLQHFLTVIFDKLDKGESWDDDFELNTILQESIRNSADGMLLSASDSLVVSLSKSDGLNDEQQSLPSSTPQRGFDRNYGINGLDFLRFTYKVSWPLELIANTEAMKKYNQVMHFLLKVKRAKYVLDKARRWIWKGRGTAAVKRKRHWLLEQKLLHFVDAFHQYVMDRVYHSAWRELCEGMAAARSLDEVIEVHEGYLLTIQRQCFVVPDKLWVLIASRINSILGLALDFYSIEQTLSSGGAVSAMKARCEMEVDRIEKQFDSCIAFLLRILSLKLNVGHFPHLADLVTRINYNYFYMSDSGSLVTVPGSDTVSSKPVKPFSIRTD